MLTFPVRLASLIFITLFCSSRLVRRLVAAVAVSAILVAAQNGEVVQAFSAHGGHVAVLKALAALASG